jgi:hypothetical protein
VYIQRIMSDVIIRDLSPEIVAAIEGHAKRAKASRQQFLHQLLTRMFGSEESATSAIAERLRLLFLALRECSISIVSVAKELGHSSAAGLEANVSGELPLTFPVADELCKLLNIQPTWLLTGNSAPFYQEPRFRDAEDCLRSLVLGQLASPAGAAYTHWYLVLCDSEDGSAAIYGYSSAAPYQYDLILRDVPMSDHVGTTGSRQIFEFALLAAAIDPSLASLRQFPVKFCSFGRIFGAELYRQITAGEIYPGMLRRSGYVHSPWAEDLWDLDWSGQPYTSNFLQARDIFRRRATEKNIKNNSDLKLHVASRILSYQESLPL